MRKLIATLIALIGGMGQLSAASPASVVEKWGVYAALAEKGWWLGSTGQVQHYSWVVPGEQLKLEQFEADGTQTFSGILRIEGRVFINGTLSRATITSSSSRHVSFGAANTLELDDNQYELKHSFISNGKPMELRYERIQAPLFPSTELRTRLAASAPCPPNLTALEKSLISIRATTAQAEQPVVQTGGNFFVGGYAGERSYDVTSFRFLETRPTKVITGIIGGRPSDLEAMLPSHDPSRYEAAFRASFPRGWVQCDKYGCRWRPREDTWKAPKGSLIGASIEQVIYSQTELMFRCQYR